MTASRASGLWRGFDVPEGVGTIDFRLPIPEEVQIRAVEQEDSRHRPRMYRNQCRMG